VKAFDLIMRLNIYCTDAFICLSFPILCMQFTNSLMILHEAMRQHTQYSNNCIATSLLLLKTNKGQIRRIRSASVSTLQSHKFRLKAADLIISEALQQITNCVYIFECLCV